MTKARVIELCDNDDMRIRILDHKDKSEIGETYTVKNKSKYFLLLDILTKSDLKDGDIVTLRNGDRLMYFDKYFSDLKEVHDNFLCDIDDLNNDLTYNESDEKENDIVKVERVAKYEVVYERNEEVKEMTVEEISKALGYEVKIVK